MCMQREFLPCANKKNGMELLLITTSALNQINDYIRSDESFNDYMYSFFSSQQQYLYCYTTIQNFAGFLKK